MVSVDRPLPPTGSQRPPSHRPLPPTGTSPNLGEEFKYSYFPVLPSFRGLRLRQSEPLAPSKRASVLLSLSLPKNSRKMKTLCLCVSALRKKTRCKHHIWPLSPQERSDISLYLPLSPKELQANMQAALSSALLSEASLLHSCTPYEKSSAPLRSERK